MTIVHQLAIAAPIERVWDLTADIERWPSVTPTITGVERLDEGPLGVGSRARLVQPRQRPRVWTVTRFEPGSVFEWHAPVGWMTMTARHRLDDVDGGCLNTLEVELHGRGSSLVERLVGSKLHQAIATENEGFRQAAEAVGRQRSAS